MSKPDAKELKKMSKAVNKLGIAEDKIDIKAPFDTMMDEFLLAMMRIQDKGETDKFTPEMIDFYNVCIEYHDSKDEGSNDEFDREKLEEELTEMDFEELTEFCEENEIEIEMVEDDFEDEAENYIEEILDKMEEKLSEGGSDDDDSEAEKMKAELEKLTVKEFKAYVKEDPELKAAIGTIKTKEFDDIKAELIGKIIAIKCPDEKENDILPSELAAMSVKEIKAYLADNGIEIKIKAKDWKDVKAKAEIIKQIILAKMGDDNGSADEYDRDECEEKLNDMDFEQMQAFIDANGLEVEIDEDDFEDEKEDYIEEILDEMDEKQGDDSNGKSAGNKENPLAAELGKMDYKAFKDYIKQANLKDKISKFKKSDFESSKAGLIEEIIELASTATGKADKGSVKAKDKVKTGKKGGTKPALRKAGNTVQEIIARVIKAAKKPMTKDEIIAEATELRKEAGQSITSVANFTNIVLLTGLELGVIVHDKTKDTYKLK